MGELLIHDNRVVGYEVDGAQRRIVLHTQTDYREPQERTDLIFEGVVAYFFEGDNFGNILFGVDELPIPQLVARHRRLFEEGLAYHWPGAWNASPEASVEHMQSVGARAFEISSSYGLCGWVAATSYRLQPASQPPA